LDNTTEYMSIHGHINISTCGSIGGYRRYGCISLLGRLDGPKKSEKPVQTEFTSNIFCLDAQFIS